MSDAEMVPVTQAARDAAAAFYGPYLARPGEVLVTAHMRAGEIDESPLIQAFARAMLAAEAAAIEKCAQVADEHAQGCAMARSNANAFNDRPAASRADAERLGAELIATAIRSLKQGASHVG